tara:strand:+ start:592 stop:789 length:198 start_codon:yes stop_codon:yes gene_type:complete
MVQSKIYILKAAIELDHGLSFKGNEEFHIVSDVVYMQGHMLPPDLQDYFYNWITKNPKLFRIDIR